MADRHHPPHAAERGGAAPAAHGKGDTDPMGLPGDGSPIVAGGAGAPDMIAMMAEAAHASPGYAKILATLATAAAATPPPAAARKNDESRLRGPAKGAVVRPVAAEDPAPEHATRPLGGVTAKVLKKTAVGLGPPVEIAHAVAGAVPVEPDPSPAAEAEAVAAADEPTGVVPVADALAILDAPAEDPYRLAGRTITGTDRFAVPGEARAWQRAAEAAPAPTPAEESQAAEEPLGEESAPPSKWAVEAQARAAEREAVIDKDALPSAALFAHQAEPEPPVTKQPLLAKEVWLLLAGVVIASVVLALLVRNAEEAPDTATESAMSAPLAPLPSQPTSARPSEEVAPPPAPAAMPSAITSTAPEPQDAVNPEKHATQPAPAPVPVVSSAPPRPDPVPAPPPKPSSSLPQFPEEHR
jgi:hypothetical protein